MPNHDPTRVASAVGHHVLSVAIRFPAALFVAVLLTDVIYWRTADPMWTTMSSWLLFGGLVAATVAILAELIRVLRDRGLQRLRPAWMHLAGNGLAVLLSVVNFVFHVRDGFSAVVPAGPLLSAAVVLILILTGWVWSPPSSNLRAELAAGGAANRKEA